jgi:predicted N-acetyltransferase YhbS
VTEALYRSARCRGGNRWRSRLRHLEDKEVIDGPRGVRVEDQTSLRALTDKVMRVGLVDQYPQLFDVYNGENLSICADDGKCVSHVGMIQRWATLQGCTIRVGGIGGVCTDPDYRNQGLASLCFDRAMAKAHTDGVDLMIVSGDRDLYRRRGCVHVGNVTHFSVPQDAIPEAMERAAVDVTVDTATDAEMEAIAALYQNEPVRYVRLPADYRFARQSTYVMNRPSDFVTIRVHGALRAYAIQTRAEPGQSCRLLEWAGDRHALFGAIPHLLRRSALAGLSVPVVAYDTLLVDLFQAVGLTGTRQTSPGTVTLVNYLQLMERLRPRFLEFLGDIGADLRFSEAAGDYSILLGDEAFTTDRSTMGRFLFGNAEGWVEPEVPLPGALREALRQVLPLPALWFGINYV